MSAYKPRRAPLMNAPRQLMTDQQKRAEDARADVTAYLTEGADLARMKDLAKRIAYKGAGRDAIRELCERVLDLESAS